MAQVITTYKPNFIPISITGTDVGVFHELTIPTGVPQSGAVDLIVTGVNEQRWSSNINCATWSECGIYGTCVNQSRYGPSAGCIPRVVFQE